MNQVVLRLDRVSIRFKFNILDSGKGKLFNEKFIRRIVLDKNLKFKVLGVNRFLLQRLNFVKFVNEKEVKSRKEQKEFFIGKLVSEIKSENKVKVVDLLVLKKENEELF